MGGVKREQMEEYGEDMMRHWVPTGYDIYVSFCAWMDRLWPVSTTQTKPTHPPTAAITFTHQTRTPQVVGVQECVCLPEIRKALLAFLGA